MRMHCALIGLGVASSLAMAQANVVIDDSNANWLAWMNVVDEVNPGDAWGSGWGIPDLRSTFDDGAQTLTNQANALDDSNEYWYYGQLGDTNPGGPGALGRKIMEANLYQEDQSAALKGLDINFSGDLLSHTMPDHQVFVFIKQFAADWSSWSGTVLELTAAGNFSIDYTTDIAGGAVQWGIQTIGHNYWSTDADAAGSAVFGTVPTPASAALLGLGGLIATRRRR